MIHLLPEHIMVLIILAIIYIVIRPRSENIMEGLRVARPYYNKRKKFLQGLKRRQFLIDPDIMPNLPHHRLDTYYYPLVLGDTNTNHNKKNPCFPDQYPWFHMEGN